MTPKSQALQAQTFDLWGSRLIEASAGTGKTWTIAALYLRLVLGHGGTHGFARPLRPAEILVMTFTRAATRELSERIRERLLMAAQCFRGERAVDAHDDFLAGLMADYPEGPARNRAAWALALAAQSMDDAAVHTIDAWCQRMLTEHAFDSGNLFDETLVADEELMQIEAAQDYWRQACYPLPQEALAQLLSIWSGVQALIKDMRDLKDQPIAPEAGHGTLQEVLQQAVDARATALAQLKAGWAERAQHMQDWLDAQTAKTAKTANGWDGRKLSPSNYRKWLAALKDWANGHTPDETPDLKTGWQRFTPDGLLQARKPDAPALTAAELPPEFAQFAGLADALAQLPSVAQPVRLHAAAQVAQRLLRLKRQTGSFGFADMLRRLNSALHGERGQRLRERILAQYPVILIDEFQDTSPLQYQIFDQIYRTQANDPACGLLLIGDPKQSIYGFRGADIYSYLQARRATAGRHYMLQTNYRSTRALVDVVNHCFAAADSQREEGAFMYRTPVENPLPFVPVDARGRPEQLVCASGPVPAMTLVHDLDLHATRDMRQAFAARCAEQVVTWLNDPQAGFARLDQPGVADGFQALRPADIAILVRTGQEASAVQRALARRGVASVYLSDKESVLQSREAQDLVHWLRAVAAPQDVRLVRAGLATALLGLSLATLAQLAADDEAFDAYAEQLRQLRSTWQQQGVLAMLRQTLHQFGLAARFLQQTGGERSLTNVLHLAELLQNASTTLDGEQALVRWLQLAISEEAGQNDEQVVRLESDADLVKVITIHKSKGLEYPLVCLPFATSFREKDSKTTTFVNLADETGQRTLQLDVSKDALARADRERLREDLRLLYVALTRARHALWLGFSALKVGQGEACVSHKSAAGYLLGGTEAVQAADWQPLLTQFAAGLAPHIALQAAVTNPPCTPLRRSDALLALQDPPPYQADFERNWTIGSFSALTRNLNATALATPLTQLSPLQVTRPADDEVPLVGDAADLPSLPDLPFVGAQPSGRWLLGVPGSIAQRAGLLQGQPVQPVLQPDWHTFARGPQAGNFLHDQLEWLAAERFALGANPALDARLQRACARSGFDAQIALVTTWLTQVVHTVLPGPNVALADLQNVLPEMEFWLPTEHLQASQIDTLCRTHWLPGVPRPPLAGRQLHGMLMGFADLVFEHQGRYWVLDYKSNHLGPTDADYDHDTLARAMAHHRYDVQAAIYLLALHRLLTARLGSDYRPADHLGGAVYLFLRGINGPEQGVCLIPASLPLLTALDASLQPTPTPV